MIKQFGHCADDHDSGLSNKKKKSRNIPPNINNSNYLKYREMKNTVKQHHC